MHSAEPEPGPCERIQDALTRVAVLLLDAGAEQELRAYLEAHPGLVNQRTAFAGESYFQNPVLLSFVAENPVRNGRLPASIVAMGDARHLLGSANGQDRHRALALASQFGHTDFVRLLLDAGQDPCRYNPPGFHAHSTPLHQSAFAGHRETVRLLLEYGADAQAKDAIWQATAAEWARHAGREEIARDLPIWSGSQNPRGAAD